jgi:endo-1,4-beta-D-glucanase Y
MPRACTRAWAGLLLVAGVLAAPAQAACAWQAWERFARDYISEDGRVIDRGSPQQITTSEGQSYALFFALVANDRARFDRLLRWTENNLARGDLTSALPAWLWGRRDDGGWGVLDDNPASDSDLWIAWTLGEAGRLWRHRHHRVLGAVLGNRILAEETADIPGLGRSLLPAPVGFVKPEGWRLNPSYVPLQLLRGLQAQNPEAGWDRLLEPSRRLIVEPAVKGYAPEWVVWTRQGAFAADPETRGEGSYNAIRVYLWAGMLAPEEPLRAPLLQALRPMAERVAAEGAPPERIDTASGAAPHAGPFGFSAALLPFLEASGLPQAAAAQSARAAALAAKDSGPAYYSEVLSLFGRGWQERRYRFDREGRLVPDWSRACAATA